jgi:hypothetical protein
MVTAELCHSSIATHSDESTSSAGILDKVVAL